MSFLLHGLSLLFLPSESRGKYLEIRELVATGSKIPSPQAMLKELVMKGFWGSVLDLWKADI